METEDNYSENLIPRETASIDAESRIIFSPAVYLQRYFAVEGVLRDKRWRTKLRKVADFGCAEMRFFHYLKKICGIQQVLEIDINKNLLNRVQFLVMPVTSDYLNKRSEPFEVSVVLGSIAEPDELLINTDAVIGIEIIEHVFPDVLEALPYNIFGFIKPKVAVFTTPNADFNVMFPNFQGFRHDDHKFEWSRDQFEDWAINITHRFPEYSVSFKGIGPGPDGTEHLGCCSQMAVFVKEMNETDNIAYGIASYGICTHMSCTLDYLRNTRANKIDNENQINTHSNKRIKFEISKEYEVILNVSYPVYEDNRSKEQKILDETLYRVSLLGGINGYYFKEERNLSEVPLSKIESFLSDFCDLDELKTILLCNNWVLEKCITYENVEEDCIIYDPVNMNDLKSNSSDDECYTENYLKYSQLEYNLEHHLESSDDSNWEGSSLSVDSDVNMQNLKIDEAEW